MAELNFLEKIVRRLSVKPLRIEIWSDKDYGARRLKPYAQYIKSQLQIRHPEIEILRIKRTNILCNFDHPLLAGNYWGYILLVSPNIDAYELKRTCMSLEEDCLGNRMADVDVYVAWRKKISRRDTERIINSA